DDRPPREDLGETRDVALAVAGAYTERVQLEDLAREILVQAPGAIDAGDGIGPDGNEVVEIEQHRRMALGGEQHVGIAPEDVRPDRFALIAAGHVRHLFPRHAEMVRPEPDQALRKADFGIERGIEPGSDLLEEDLPLDGRGLGELRRSGRSGRLGALPRRAGVLARGPAAPSRRVARRWPARAAPRAPRRRRVRPARWS